MKNIFFVSCFFLFFFSLSSANKSDNTEIIALTDLYNSLDGGNWENCRWDLNEINNYCHFCGINCDENNHVASISLPNNRLEGKIPSTINLLSNLVQIKMNNNKM